MADANADYQGIENAPSMVKLPFIKPGKYTFKVDALKKVTSRKGVTYTCGEFTVVKSGLPGGNPEGTHCALLINMAMDNALSNVKNLFASVMGEGEDKVTKQLANTLTGPQNPGSGRMVEAEACEITTKAGKPFTLVKFAPHTKK
jgi:hypothetical protein